MAIKDLVLGSTGLSGKGPVDTPVSLTDLSDYMSEQLGMSVKLTVEEPGMYHERPSSIRLVLGGQGEDPVRTGKLVAVCERCDAESEKAFKVNMAPEAMAKFLRQTGWEIDAALKHAVCPKCMHREGKKMTKLSPEVMRQQHKAYDLIDAHFNADKGAYEHGWDDRKIADTTGLSEAIVAEMREAVAGPIRVDPALVEAQIELVEARAAFEREVRELHGLIDAAEHVMRERLGKIEASITAVTSKSKLRAVS